MRLVATTLAVLLLASCDTSSPVHMPPPDFPQHTPISSGKMCGGMMGARCSNPNEFCQYSRQAMCGAADASGVCAPKPEICTQEYGPVCGCGDTTYSNACSAAAAGVSIAYDGECRP